MNGTRTNPESLTGKEWDFLEGFHGGAGQKTHLSGIEEDGLVLHFVILKGKGFAGIDVKDLPDILFGLGPDQLIAPGLFDPMRSLFH
jgi:hypothetical protein